MQLKNFTPINFFGSKRLWSGLFLMFFVVFYGYGQCSMSCDDEIQVSLNNECEAEITYRMILRDPDNSDICSPNGPSAYIVVIMDEEGVEIPSSPIITCEHVGRTLLVKVKHWYSGNSCWSKVVVEDKIAPRITCEPVELWCNENTAPVSEGGSAPNPILMDLCADDCGAVAFEYEDKTVLNACGDEGYLNGIVGTIYRTWKACDEEGNCSTCVQTITLRGVDLSKINLPPNYIGENAFSCTDFDPEDLSATGYPSLHELVIQEDICRIHIFHKDHIIPDCEGGYVIHRKWTLLNTCTDETLEHVQVIEVADQTAPVIICNDDNLEVMATATLTPFSCLATVMIPSATITDDCSSPENIHVITKIYGTDSETGQKKVVARVEDANGGFMQELEYGTYEIYYQATDACGNISNNLDDPCIIEVEDDIPPTPVCNALTKLSLDREGKGIIYAGSFDNGSYDNCCIESFQVRRMDIDSSEFMNYVEFDCEDTQIDGPLMVVLQVTDCYGNSAICMIEVLIDDKTPPTIISCADPISIACKTNLSLADIRDSLLTPPMAEDDCIGGLTYQAMLKEDFRNDCGVGAVIYTWEVYDAAGNGPATCDQLVAFVDETPVTINFPADFLDTTCVTSVDELTPDRTGNIEIIGNDCETVEFFYDDSPVHGNDPSCMTFYRTWLARNICTDSIYEHVQMISVKDVEAPILNCNGEFFDICLDGGACSRSFAIEGVVATDCSNEVNITAKWTFTPADICTGEITTGTIEDAGDGFMGPEVGPGQLWVDFYATDACGNQSVCRRDYTVKDCQAPEIICIPGLTLNVDDEGIVEVWANDFHSEIIDNCDDCDGTDYIFSFSQDTSETVRFYGCSDLGVKTAQIWITDASGNQNFCPVTFVIKGADICAGLGQDTTMNEEPGGMAGIAGKIFKEEGEAVEAVEVIAENHLSEMMDMHLTDNSGTYAFEFQRSANVVINPKKEEDVLNGVTTFDILQLRRHILGFAELDSPYKMIAADVNRSNSITTADIVALRKVILQVDETFKNNTSWRFIQADHTFTDPSNPFSEAIPEYATVPELTEATNVDFVAVKIGDLNGNAIGQKSLNPMAQSRNRPQISVTTRDRQIKKNTIETITFNLAKTDIQALQMTLNFDPALVELVDIPAMGAIRKANFGTRFLSRGALTMSWEAPTNINESMSFQLKVKTNRTVAVSELFTINSAFTPAEAYDGLGKVYQVGLVFLDNKYDYALFQNQPNPFKQTTTIRFSLPAKSQGKLTILDNTGRTLKSIEQTFEKGINEVELIDLDQKGLLFYQLETAFGIQTQKMLRVE